MEPDLIRHKLKEFFGYDTFKGDQEEVITHVMGGGDAFVLMPTGGGKSLCYQLPALLMEGTAIVVSPLIALMKNQVDLMRGFDAGAGSVAHFLNSSLSRLQIEEVRSDLLAGRTKLLYVAPESLSKEENVSFLQEVKISFYAIDEAHCISEWGHDFRPEYRNIRDMVNRIGRAPIIALTATATPKVQSDILKNLRIQDAKVFKSSFNRSNLYYEVRDKVEAEKDIIRYIKQNPGKSGIIYCLSRKKVEELAELLCINGISALPYHAGLDAKTRAENQDKFLSEDVDVIVATIAFGMGIDKPDVRFVVHLGLADSLESYFQEAGRAGRDGQRSWAVLVWNSSDIRRIGMLTKLSFPSPEYIEDIYQKIHIFSQIPYEQGMGAQLKFDIPLFCKHFSLKQTEVLYAVKYLEMSDHLSYSEDVDIATRVKILIDRKALYDFEFQDAMQERLLELMIRKYPGIFSFSVPVDEEYLSRQCGVSVPSLRQLLYSLSVLHLIKYVPASHDSVIFLHHSRLVPGNLDLQPGKYNFLKDNFIRRTQAMVEYASETDECRSRFLLKYFGQNESTDCGQCDVCRSIRSKSLSQDERSRYDKFVDKS